MLQDGQRLGEFEILAKLGQGGMGAVYKARQTVLRRLVAIKTLQPSLSSDAEFISRFHNEAIAAAGLNHPNLVQVYAAGESDGIHWFAMEFVDGECVQSRLKRLGKLEPAEALAIGMHVQTALEYGWRKAQLIHRDIKPDNIFLSNDGEVKLGDLGLAKSSDQQQGLTMTGASMGTPLYISPEQTEGKRDIDLRTDIYSLGATLYHLIAGAPPYTGESAISVMMKHVGATVPDIRELDPSLPPALSALLVKMMQKAPADRYGSYEALGVDLRQAYAALSDSGASAPAAVNEPAGAGGATNKKRPAWLLPAVAVPLVALGAFALLKSKGPAPGEKSPFEAPQVAANDTQPPVGKVPVENAKAETRPGVDPIQELVRKLEAKLLPVPGTEVLMSKTELTVGEWKLYLNAEGLPEWKQPDPDWKQTDEHPVVNVSWDDSKKLCDWLSTKTGKQWRLPTNAERDAALGTLAYPWGDYFPPMWDDGNYKILEDGKDDPKSVGVDGILGTAPVGSFKPNALGFYDLGGNAWEWMWDGLDEKTGKRVLRGASWSCSGALSGSAIRDGNAPGFIRNSFGLRLVRVKTAAEKAAPPAATSATPGPAIDSPTELLLKLEAKLLPVPGTNILMSKTELTVGEWKTYLKSTKLPTWTAPKEFPQTDEHPVVDVSAMQAVAFCRWLSAQSNNAWRLPANEEWDAASPSNYPWGDYFPPKSNDGNYAMSESGTYDSNKMGADGIFGTAPVGSFKSNPLGFYDLGGNAAEWAGDEGSNFHLRGAGWMDPGINVDTASFGSKYRRTNQEGRPFSGDGYNTVNRGFRVVRVKTTANKVATPPATPDKKSAEQPPPPAQPKEDTTPKPPKGFLPLFDGATLSGWRGLNPHEVLKAAPDQKAALVQQQGQEFPNHWRVQTGELVNSGTGPYATTLESFGNIDLLVEYKAAPLAEGGIYLRGTPEIKIWDSTQKDNKNMRRSLGSGGLYQNNPGSPGRYPLVHADKPLGQWNQFRIRQIGARTWIWLNEKQVVDGALWEPFWEPTKPLPEKAPLILQTSGGEIRWRNLFVRKIADAEASEMLKVWNNTQIPQKNTPPKTPLENLVRRLEAKLLPVPGTKVQMCKTHVTVGEWKIFQKETKAPDWRQPDKDWVQTDEHPVVFVSWTDSQTFCKWLSEKSGKIWRLPTVAEWQAAVGNLEYPWGNYFPPVWNDGNYAFLADGTNDPQRIGSDGIKGTAPVASFRPNTLGFYDLGGNAHHWMMDADPNANRPNRHALRGGGWRETKNGLSTSEASDHRSNNIGFRLVRE